MTRAEKLIIAVTVVVLGIGSMALMWTSRQVGVVQRDDSTPQTTVVTAPAAEVRPSRPPPPAAIPVAQVAPQEEASGGVAPATPADDVQPSEEERTERREQRNAAVRSLQAVEAQLATGNTDGVDEVLSNTADQLEEPARSSVRAARVALENKDLTLARAEVIRAMSASPSR